MLVAGDVGGTKTVLALYEVGVGSLEKVREQTFPSGGFPSLEAIVEKFLAGGPKQPLRAACFGVPGVVIDGRCKTTNLPWVIEEGALAGALSVAHLKLLNDLEACAYGMLHLKRDELSNLSPGLGGPKKGNIAVIAAGTGLGQAMLYWDGWRHHPVASEGGHASFAPQSDDEVGLWKFLHKKYGGHVSWERVLSGMGVANIYEYLKDAGRHPESPKVAEKLRHQDPGAVIGMEALAASDPLCTATLEMFASLYGAEAGNLALKCLATGGVYVAGGIAPKIWPVLKRGGFMKAFVDKGRLGELMRTIEVNVAMNAAAPLLGAAHFAARLG